MRFENGGAREQQAGSLRAVSPPPVADKCLVRRLDSGIHLRRTSTLDDRDDLARRGIFHRGSVGGPRSQRTALAIEQALEDRPAFKSGPETIDGEGRDDRDHEDS